MRIPIRSAAEAVAPAEVALLMKSAADAAAAAQAASARPKVDAVAVAGERAVFARMAHA